MLSQLEGDAMLRLIEAVLVLVPFEAWAVSNMVILPYIYMAR
jgi:hypothetical protein